MMKSHFVASLCLLALTSAAVAQVPSNKGDFPQWRGANRDGISGDTGLLKEWPDDGPSVLWRIEDVGVGYSSLAIKDGVIVTMGDLDGVEHIIAIRAQDGSVVWAVQPEPQAKALAERTKREFESYDANNDGAIDELEGLARLGWSMFKLDADGEPRLVEVRAERVFQAFDKNSNKALDYGELGRLADRFANMDSTTTEDVLELAKRRADESILATDKDNDGKISRAESRSHYVGRIFGRADKRDPTTNESDQVLTREELESYYAKREGGKDGKISPAEFTKYYVAQVKGGDGFISLAELSGHLGGYRNGQGDGPRGTPTIDGDRVYAEGGNGDVTCLDLKTGRTIWHTNLVTDHGGRRPGWGYSESPLVVGDLVIVTPGGNEGAVLALNKATGETVWRSSDYVDQAHYSSPVVATIAGVQQIVQFTRGNLFGLALDDGRLLWKYAGACNGTANCCTPIVDKDHVFAASAYGTGGGLVQVTNEGDTQKAAEKYFEKRLGVHHGGIVKIGDYMYTNGAGTLVCVHFLTGEIMWQARSVGKGSLVAADGMLYVLSERQQMALVEATPEEYRERGRIRLESHGRPSWAHPVVTGGVLYIRDQHTLTAYKVR